MNVLIIAPHPDDEAIGCGGAVRLHVERGDRVDVVFLTSGELGLKQLSRQDAWAKRESEAQAAAKILGVSHLHFLQQPDWFLGDHIPAAIEAALPVLRRTAPDLIYLPHPREWHPDHQAALPIVRGALARLEKIAVELRGYEIWTPLSEFDHVEDISNVMEVKLTAVRAHSSQMTEFPYDRAIAGLNQYRGVIAGRCQFAEVFQTLSVTA